MLSAFLHPLVLQALTTQALLIGKPITRSPMQNHQNGKDMQQSGHQQPQVNSAEDGETNVLAENSARKNFTRNLRGYGEIESSYMRFQKSQFHHSKSANGSQRPFNKPGGRGHSYCILQH
ncbi:uncharacterized protein LOC120110284 isoform X3 [Phoenix dactylifera]|uniref:Uncharacterized protein LOC120110284 isoform X3 n=1 Tax=Phoenix dactylifera TaxID=42345 RepID=A0A8B9AC18_PHODC|nr:uncharacterized protein LOC120110284 isoform X3 [Phoenix dactylifera]